MADCVFLMDKKDVICISKSIQKWTNKIIEKGIFGLDWGKIAVGGVVQMSVAKPADNEQI